MIIQTRYYLNFLAFVACLLLQSGCAVHFSESFLDKNPNTALRTASNSTISWAQREYGFVSNPMLNEYVTSVLHKLGARKPAGSYQAFLICSRESMAFSTAGNVIFVSNGLFESLETEAQFAAVLAHEMAHHDLCHTNVQDGNSLSVGGNPSLVFDMEQESSADKYALRLLSNAQYCQTGLLEALRIIQSKLPANSDSLDKRIAKFRNIPIACTSIDSVNTREFRKAKHVASLVTCDK